MPSEMEKKLSFKNLRVKITSPNILISLQSVDIHASECKRVSEPSPFGVLINTARLSKYLPNIYLMY